PSLAANPQTGHRYNAACCAALAGTGQGDDATGLDDRARARLRGKALDWLRADLAAHRAMLARQPQVVRQTLARTMRHWLRATARAGVHGEQALARLGAAERRRWQQLWTEVEELRHSTTRA